MTQASGITRLATLRDEPPAAMPGGPADPILVVDHLTMRFGGLTAVGDLSFKVGRGDITALIGPNGAGKSTLVKILSGADRPTAGEILLDGRPVAFGSPSDAQRRGIATVYQDLALAPDLTPAENLFLGRETTRSGLLGRLGFLDRPAMRR